MDDVADEGGPNSVLRLSLPIGLVLFAIGLAFGLLVVDAGLQWWWAPVFTGVVYAGSLEFLLIGLSVAAAPLAQVALTALVVNSRHVFYALSFPLHRVRGWPAKVYSTFALTDEAYAVISDTVYRWSTRSIILVQIGFQVAWVGGATVGALVGSALPLDKVHGLEFALTALFVVLAVDAYRVSPDRVVLAAAALCAVAAWLVAPEQMLVVAFAAYTAVLLTRMVVDRRRSVND